MCATRGQVSAAEPITTDEKRSIKSDPFTGNIFEKKKLGTLIASNLMCPVSKMTSDDNVQLKFSLRSFSMVGETASESSVPDLPESAEEG